MPRHPSAGGRRVSFQDGPPEEIGITQRAPSPAVNPASGAKPSKWQPLASVEPSPVTDHDPFSLGDSDDEEPKKPAKQENVAPKASADKAGPEVSPKVDLEPKADDHSDAKDDAQESLTIKP